MEISNELIQHIVPYVAGFVPVLITQVIIYNKIKWDVEQLKRSINGVGTKINDIDSKVDEQNVEQILRSGHALEEIAHIRGIIEGLYKPILKNGQA